MNTKALTPLPEEMFYGEIDNEDELYWKAIFKELDNEDDLDNEDEIATSIVVGLAARARAPRHIITEIYSSKAISTPQWQQPFSQRRTQRLPSSSSFKPFAPLTPISQVTTSPEQVDVHATTARSTDADERHAITNQSEKTSQLSSEPTQHQPHSSPSHQALVRTKPHPYSLAVYNRQGL